VDPTTVNFWSVVTTALPLLAAGWLTLGALATGLSILVRAIYVAVQGT
jgi:hypothetical protein